MLETTASIFESLHNEGNLTSEATPKFTEDKLVENNQLYGMNVVLKKNHFILKT